MSEKYNDFAANSQEKSPKAMYHYCYNHDLIKSGPLQELLGARSIQSCNVRFNETTFSLLSEEEQASRANCGHREQRKTHGTHHYKIKNSVKPDRWR